MMITKQPAYLTEIELANFQVFVEPTKIAIGPLTLLYGPNSAGKSALSDAMTLLNRTGFRGGRLV